MRTPALHRSAGFTLVEMIVAIVVTGILVGISSMFIRNQITSYTDLARRTEMADTADGALRRMARDIQRALPNSPRTLGAACVEFVPTKTGGRYRAEALSGTDFLDFTAADTSFNMYGPLSALPGQAIAVGDLISIYNLGIAGADVYAQDNTAAVTAPAPAYSAVTGETTITIASKLFPLASASNRFHVIPAGEQVVGYLCAGVGTNADGDGTGTLFRYVTTLPSLAPVPPACPAAPAGAAVLATNVSACNFVYTPGVLQRSALVSLSLAIQRASENVTLYHQINVVNTP